MEVVCCVEDNPKVVKEAIAKIEKAMTSDIKLVENYGFPKELPISVSVDIGYRWGETIDIENYLKGV